jgi:SdpC family antimicrobial peptide
MLQRIRTLRPVTASFLLATFGFGTLASCANDQTGPSRGSVAAPPALAGVTGEEAFRGIFFGEGRVGAHLPQIWHGKSMVQRIAVRFSGKPEQAVAVKSGIDYLIARIQRHDPTFFSRFGTAVQSGNRVEVSAALEEAGSLVKLLASGKDRVIKPDMKAIVALVYAVAVYEIAVAVIAAVFSPIHTQIMVQGRAQSPLKWDTIVDILARDLRARPAAP